jgi:hypothetical protein
MYHRIYRQVDGQQIPGTFVLAFIHTYRNSYELTPIKAYRDGVVDPSSIGAELVDLDRFKRLVRRGKITAQLPEGAEVHVSDMDIFFTVSDVGVMVDAEGFITQVEDEIRALRGEPTTSDGCRAAYDAYQVDPSDTAKERLRAAYDAVPAHQRRFLLGDMDSKDAAIREVLGDDNDGDDGDDTEDADRDETE